MNPCQTRLMSETHDQSAHRTLFSVTMALLVMMLTILVLATLWSNNRHLLQVIANDALQPYGLVVEQMDNLTFHQSGLLIEQITVKHPASDLELNLRKLVLQPSLDPARRITVRTDPLTIRWSGSLVDEAVGSELHIRDLHADIPATLLECDSQYNCRATVASDGHFTIAEMNYDGFGLSRVSAHWRSPLSFVYTSESGLSVDQLQTDSQFSISKFQTGPLAANLADFQFQQSVSFRNQVLNADINASFLDTSILSTNISQDLQSGQGNGEFILNALRFDSQHPLSRLLPSIPWDIDIVEGQLLANGSLNWQLSNLQFTRLQGPVTLMAQSLSGYAGDAVFTRLGWHAPLLLRTDRTIESRDTVSIALAGLDIGVMLTDISTRARFDTDSLTLELDRPSIGAFGGTVTAHGATWQPGQTSDIDVQLRNINIAQILSLSAYQAVSATGILNGQLPVQLTGTQATIAGGLISAAPPGGTISYRHSSQTTGSTSTDLVFRALQRYNYDTMEMQVDLLANGDLILSTALEGSSPMLNDGQRINLNLNITDNIPSLLNSLQAGRSVTDTLARRLNE